MVLTGGVLCAHGEYARMGATQRRSDMRRRVLQLVAVVATITCVALVLTTVHGQTTSTPKPARATKAGPAAKTPWGEPNLEGIWTQEYAEPVERDRKSTRLNSSHIQKSRMPSSA